MTKTPNILIADLKAELAETQDAGVARRAALLDLLM